MSSQTMAGSPALLQLTDYFFLVFHSFLILFNLFGWMWDRLKKWHFISICMTLGSWLLLGIWYGLGYCPLTDLHWNILKKLGETDLPDSYISYLLQRFFGLSLPGSLVDILTVSFTLLALVASVYVNFLKGKKD